MKSSGARTLTGWRALVAGGLLGYAGPAVSKFVLAGLLVVLTAGCSTQASRTTELKVQWSYIYGSQDSPLNHLGDLNWKPTTKLYNPPGRNGSRVLWLRGKLPQNRGSLRLFVKGIEQAACFYEDKRCFYRTGGLGPSQNDLTGYPFHLVFLPGTDFIYVKVFSELRDIGFFGDVYLTSAADLYYKIIWSSIGLIVTGGILLAAGLILLIPSVLQRNWKLIGPLALLFLLSGTYLVCRTELKQILLNAPGFWLVAEFWSFYLLMVPTAYFFRDFFGSGQNSILDWLPPVWLGICLATAVGWLVGFYSLGATLPFFQVAFLIAALYLTGFCIVRAIDGNVGARIIAGGVVIGLACVVHDILQSLGVIATQGRVAHIGAFLFLMSLLVVLIQGIRKNQVLLSKTQKYLQRVIKELESSVQNRTAQLNRSQSELQSILDITRQINEDAKLETVIEQTFTFIQSIFTVDVAVFYMIRDDKLHCHEFWSHEPDLLSPADIESLKGTALPLNESRAVFRPNPNFDFIPWNADDPGLEEEEADYLKKVGCERGLLIPLKSRDETNAWLLLGTDHTDFTSLEIDKLLFFCRQIAGFVSGLKLLHQTEVERKRSDQLLLNILPAKIAQELKDKGDVQPVRYEQATVMFIDIKGFTDSAKRMAPEDLMSELEPLFHQFDLICEHAGVEKLKTIGDAYMCAGGLPETNTTHAIDVCMAALEIREIVRQIGQLRAEISGGSYWQVRIGIHTGPVIAGVIGRKKFAYDIWGDTVNVASRMESTGHPGAISISVDTWQLVQSFFNCELRGEVELKNRGRSQVYHLLGLKEELLDKDGSPSGQYKEQYKQVAAQIQRN